MTTTSRPPTLDPNAVSRWQRAAPLASPWLHEEVATRMQERLQWIKLQPQAWAHWGALRGGLQAHAKLATLYPAATCFVAEATPERAQAAWKIRAPWKYLLAKFPSPSISNPVSQPFGLLSL